MDNDRNGGTREEQVDFEENKCITEVLEERQDLKYSIIMPQKFPQEQSRGICN